MPKVAQPTSVQRSSVVQPAFILLYVRVAALVEPD